MAVDSRPEFLFREENPLLLHVPRTAYSRDHHRWTYTAVFSNEHGILARNEKPQLLIHKRYNAIVSIFR